MFQRLQRKLGDVRKYPALGADAASRRDLLALALWRNRLVSPATAAWFSARREASLNPRLLTTHGEPVAIRLGDWSETDCFDELFIDGIYTLSSVPFSPDLVIDCGAFHGYFTVLACGHFPQAKLVAFEPNPEHQTRLAAQLQQLSRPVEQIAAAVGVADGSANFSGHGMGGAVVASGAANPDMHRVKVINFPQWLNARQPRRLVWKLDVEGAEMELLPAALPSLPVNTALFLETHYPALECERLLAPYRATGFQITQVRERIQDGKVYIEWFLLRTGT